jgi:hypothetical protein
MIQKEREDRSIVTSLFLPICAMDKRETKSSKLNKQFLTIQKAIVEDTLELVQTSQNVVSLRVPAVKHLNKGEGITKAYLDNLFIGLDSGYKCFKYDHLGSENALVTDVNEAALQECLLQTNKLLDSALTLNCGNLQINEAAASITFRDRTVHFPITENFAKFFILLIRNSEKIVSYKETGESLRLRVDVSSYDLEREDDINAAYASSVQNYKNELISFLRTNLKISQNLLNTAIKNIPGKGYKLMPAIFK